MSIVPSAPMTVVVMAKLPRPGYVKTRMTVGETFDDVAAAELASALLECTMARLSEWARATQAPIVLALGWNGDDRTDAPDDAPVPDEIVSELCGHLGAMQWPVVRQGPGDLGDRLDRVWRGIAGPVVFFGTDAPDVPASALAAIGRGLEETDLAIGPTEDGGYWTLASSTYTPAVIDRIDWGGAGVYDQTLRRARDRGMSVTELPMWSDIDHPDDVSALRRRLERPVPSTESEPSPAALRRLAQRLDSLTMNRPLVVEFPRDATGAVRAHAMYEDDALTTLPEGFEGSELPELDDATVLLVDDNAQNLELIQAYLEALPCRIVTARDGVEAVDAIEHEPPDLVLLDVMMPRMSGFEVCQKIKSGPRTRDIMVIMVTALHEVGDFERAVECGTDDFLTKPVNKLELLTRVKSLLRVRLLKRRLDELLAMRQGSGPSGGGRAGGRGAGEAGGGPGSDTPREE